jgi:hypothetical protein
VQALGRIADVGLTEGECIERIPDVEANGSEHEIGVVKKTH